MAHEYKVGDVVCVINVARDGISRVKIIGQKSKMIFITEQIVAPNPRAQLGRGERKASEFVSVDEAKEILIKEKTKAFESEIKRLKAIS